MGIFAPTLKEKQATAFPVSEYAGPARECGRDYGAANAEAIMGFLLMEIVPVERYLDYARECREVLEDWEPGVVDFARGMSEGCGRTLDEITLLLLHEEIVHMQPAVVAGQEHCTAFGATGGGTAGSSLRGAPLIGMNWDWRANLYSWSQVTRFNFKEGPRTLTYSYPGLWAGAGINECGLALAWTGAGYLPPVVPVAGIPTYALIAGILATASCREAISLIERTPIAGCFVFFVADSGGEVWVVEGGAGKTHCSQCAQVIGRANHYQTPEMQAASRQELVPDNNRVTTSGRARRMHELLTKYAGCIDETVATAILCDHGDAKGGGICQHPRIDFNSMTVDSLYFLPQSREMHIARGLPCRHSYQRLVV